MTEHERLTAWFSAALPSQPARVERLCLPIAAWILERVRSTTRRPVMVGLSAPQGAGKTTLTRQLVDVFREVLGLRAVAISIDDFYLRRSEQLALAAAHPSNPFLEHRGYPGTHDVELGGAVLEALRSGVAVDVPRYDKSAFEGRGDRGAEVTRVEPPVDVVFLEGWMLGFAPVSVLADERLRSANEALTKYREWTRTLDACVVLELQDVTQVVQWRVEAERAMRASGRPGLSDAEVEDYVRRFLPAYRTWRAHIDGVPELRLTLGADRLPLSSRG